MGYTLRSARYLAAEVMERALAPGDTAVDATAGNGHDTCMLARLVGENGTVYAFDVQARAIGSTAARLKEEGLAERAVLLNTGHEHIGEIIREPVAAVTFNLGWLPGGDKSVTTRWETTRRALDGALGLLRPAGICTVCVYPGHEAGETERRELSAYLSALRPQEFNVLHQSFPNAGPGAPECYVIQRQ